MVWFSTDPILLQQSLNKVSRPRIEPQKLCVQLLDVNDLVVVVLVLVLVVFAAREGREGWRGGIDLDEFLGLDACLSAGPP